MAGHIKRPMRVDPVLDRIAQRGTEHEARFLQGLTAEGVVVAVVDSADALPRSVTLN